MRPWVVGLRGRDIRSLTLLRRTEILPRVLKNIVHLGSAAQKEEGVRGRQVRGSVRKTRERVCEEYKKGEGV